jgi:hypothetical protein
MPAFACTIRCKKARQGKKEQTHSAVPAAIPEAHAHWKL